MASFKTWADQPPIWKKPKAIDWEEVGTLDDSHLPVGPVSHSTPNPIAAIFYDLEVAADHKLRIQAKPGLIPQQRGRSTHTAPSLKKNGITPLRASRQGEIAVSFMGEHFQHTHWCRQLRRLQSLCHHLRSFNPDASLARQIHLLWISIRRAPGFPQGFPMYWRRRAAAVYGDPEHLPKDAPKLAVAEGIMIAFTSDFRQLEKALVRARVAQGRTRRLADSRVCYKDVAKPRSLPVRTLAFQNNVTVVSIAEDGKSATYEPASLDCARPTFGPQGCLPVATHLPGSLASNDELMIEPGDLLYQTQHIGDMPTLFESFADLWNPMWNRKADVTFQGWAPALSQIAAAVRTPGVDFQWEPLTISSWRHAVSKRKQTSATGPDGISRADLLAMPDQLLQKLLDFLTNVEQGKAVWPEETMVGLITSLQKTEQASMPGHYRPICVFSQVYRTWSSIRAKEILTFLDKLSPDTMVGNRPAKGTKDLWWKLAQSIEHASACGLRIGGLVTDVTKCFYTIPRLLILTLGRKLCIPANLLKAWHLALATIQRRFIIDGACSPAVCSVCGYPEGDALSVAAMAILNLSLHAFVEQSVSSATLHTYVDNWEAVCVDCNQIPDVWTAVQTFADLADLKLDAQKTYAWALQGPDRKFLKDAGLRVRYDAKDLGGHVVYSKKRTVRSIKNRIDANQDVWNWLARSLAPIDQKLHLLPSVLWPRMLHGISAVWISAEHFKRMRASIMVCLGWKKKGASSLVQIGLSPELRADPGYYTMLQTFLDFRHYAEPDVAFPAMTDILHGPTARFSQGPLGAMLQRLQELSWHWLEDGFVCDHMVSCTSWIHQFNC